MDPFSLQRDAGSEEKIQHYSSVEERIRLLLDGETDIVAMMATIACELHHSFEAFQWMGFYRTLPHLKEWLIIGPYQGTHGCLRIAFGKGVCGAAAKLQQSQVVPDVHAFPGHIACASSTQSEIVVPIMSPNGVLGVLDIDSDSPAAFDEVDQRALESICMLLSRKSPPQRQGQDDIADRELLSMGTKLTT